MPTRPGRSAGSARARARRCRAQASGRSRYGAARGLWDGVGRATRPVVTRPRTRGRAPQRDQAAWPARGPTPGRWPWLPQVGRRGGSREKRAAAWLHHPNAPAGAFGETPRGLDALARADRGRLGGPRRWDGRGAPQAGRTTRAAWSRRRSSPSVDSETWCVPPRSRGHGRAPRLWDLAGSHRCSPGPSRPAERGSGRGPNAWGAPHALRLATRCATVGWGGGGRLKLRRWGDGGARGRPARWPARDGADVEREWSCRWVRVDEAPNRSRSISS